MNVTLQELYTVKGELVTQLEIVQGRLQMINQQIQAALNQAIPQTPQEVKK